MQKIAYGENWTVAKRGRMFWLGGMVFQVQEIYLPLTSADVEGENTDTLQARLWHLYTVNAQLKFGNVYQMT